MDINKLQTVGDHEDGAECNILSPVDGMPTDVYIKIKGSDSKSWRKAKKSQMTRILDARQKDSMDSLDYELMDAESLAGITIGWRGITKDSKPFEFSYENALQLYQESPSVTAQLLAFIEKRDNFTED